MLSDGYHAFEAANGIRWTDGDAAVPAELFAGMSGRGMLILEFGGTTQYLDEGSIRRAPRNNSSLGCPFNRS